MKNLKIKLTQLVIVILSLLLAFAIMHVFLGSYSISAFATESKTQAFEAKIYSQVSLDEEFDDSSVIVVMDKRTGGINKRHDESLFGNINY